MEEWLDLGKEQWQLARMFQITTAPSRVDQKSS